MARRSKGPWRRKQTGAWYTKIDGKQVKLGEADEPYEIALKRYYEAHANRDEQKPSCLLSVAQLIDDFLDWNKYNRAERTFEWYDRFLKPFHRHIGSNLLVDNLKPYHVDRWVKADYSSAKANTRRNAMRAVERCMNWAVKSGYIPLNPIRGIEKPPQESRETVITEKQYKRTLELTSKHGDFRDVLTFLWQTGCRPQEVRIIEAQHFDGETITFTKTDSKGKKHNRVIYLNETALEIVRRLAAQHPTGPLFRTSKGKPWNRNNTKCRFRYLKQELGIPGLCATVFRHTWATDVLTNGMDTTTASILMGHRDPATLARNYQHLTQNRDYLKQAAQRARATGDESQST